MSILEFRIALTVDDYQQALSFYTDGLGFTEEEIWEGDGNGRMFVASPASLELFDETYADGVDKVEVGKRVSGPIRFALKVPDLDEAISRAQNYGGKLENEPITTPWGDRNARVVSPDGMQITLYQSVAEQA